jgi:hypothetical protein
VSNAERSEQGPGNGFSSAFKGEIPQWPRGSEGMWLNSAVTDDGVRSSQALKQELKNATLRASSIKDRAEQRLLDL